MRGRMPASGTRAVQVGVGGQCAPASTAFAGGGVGGRPTKSATPSVSQRGASAAVLGARCVVEKLVAQHDSQRRIAHRSRTRGEHDPLARWWWPRCRRRRRPRLPNCASDAAATMTMSRGQSGPQNAVTASRRVVESARRSAPAAVPCAARPDRPGARCGRRATSAWSTRRVGVVSDAGVATAGPAGAASGRPTSSTRADQLGDEQSSEPATVSSGGRCRSAHCPPGRLAPACRRSTRAPSFRHRCRCRRATRRSST